MERYKLTADAAFALLVRTSQETNSELTEVAALLAERLRLPDDPRGLAERRVRRGPPSRSLAASARPRS